MDSTNITNHLISLFQQVTLYGVTDENTDELQEVLITILDSNDPALFNNLILTNLIYILELNEPSILMKHLITEVKLKSLRLIYTNRIQIMGMGTPTAQKSAPTLMTAMPKECCKKEEELPLFTNLSSLPKEGSYSRAKKIIRKDGKEFINIYRIDHTGQAIELLESKEKLVDDELHRLNNNIIERVLENIDKHHEQSTPPATAPLTEQDL